MLVFLLLAVLRLAELFVVENECFDSLLSFRQSVVWSSDRQVITDRFDRTRTIVVSSVNVDDVRLTIIKPFSMIHIFLLVLVLVLRTVIELRNRNECLLLTSASEISLPGRRLGPKSLVVVCQSRSRSVSDHVSWRCGWRCGYLGWDIRNRK